ncbi:RsbRD N-terminal domain-containing protein [Raoultibacter phocaeensis]|uniref:RsbRD N-terminal domain-containing protein n=1 Tax=Raoultibacter phocaeensis TaxID=2479841 RepID=UPI0015D59073|nr:RsbRD N-terminal domain-containing protein [Raoultibacter phocaeensis]
MNTLYGEIESRRASILKAWRASFGTESQASGFAPKKGDNRFTDSLGYLIDESTNDALTWLVRGGGKESIPETLVDLCRLKAVQEASPSAAFGFIFDLKRAIRSTCGGAALASGTEFVQVEERIDELALFAFDWYSQFREKIYRIKFDEMQRSEGLMQRRRTAKRGECEREAV